MKIKYADQEYPAKAIRKHLSGYKDYISIVKKNIPNVTSDEIIKMFDELSHTGCTAASFANVLASSISIDSNIFGFSLEEKNIMDYNRLLVDIISRLYKVAKIKFVEYERFYFDSFDDAAISLLGNNYDSEEENVRRILETKKYALDGKTDGGKIIIKSINPNVSTYVGNIDDICKRKFNTSNISSIEELKMECKKRNIEVSISDLSIREKLSSRLSGDKTGWYNYYLDSYNNCNLESTKDTIVSSDFAYDYDGFMKYINNLTSSGFKICISEPAGGISWMKKRRSLFSWGKISSSDSVGHSMFFKCFDNNNDIVVISYGNEYIIPKEFFTHLEFECISIHEKKHSDKLY